jgi:hypothetical protein
MSDNDDDDRPTPDPYLVSLERWGAPGVEWRSKLKPLEIQFQHVIPFEVAAERLSRAADVSIDTARTWLFEQCKRALFVLLDVSPRNISPRLCGDSAFPEFWKGVDAVRRSRLQVLKDEVEAAIPHLRDEVHGSDKERPTPLEPAPALRSTIGSEARRRGPREKWLWHEAGAAFGARYYSEIGAGPEPDRELLRDWVWGILIAIEPDNDEPPSNDTLDRYIDRWVAGYPAWDAKPSPRPRRK